MAASERTARAAVESGSGREIQDGGSSRRRAEKSYLAVERPLGGARGWRLTFGNLTGFGRIAIWGTDGTTDGARTKNSAAREEFSNCEQTTPS